MILNKVTDQTTDNMFLFTGFGSFFFMTQNTNVSIYISNFGDSNFGVKNSRDLTRAVFNGNGKNNVEGTLNLGGPRGGMASKDTIRPWRFYSGPNFTELLSTQIGLA